jgi:hypothetical protein
MTVAKQISKYKLHLMIVQDVRWTEMAPNQQENTHFYMENRIRIID